MIASLFAGRERCSACGSLRIVRHDERDRLSIAHIDKPRGLAVLNRQDAPVFLADKPISLLWGVGAARRIDHAMDQIRGRLRDEVGRFGREFRRDGKTLPHPEGLPTDGRIMESG